MAFYFLIGRKNPASDGTMSILVILRVVLLDGLFLIMGITLGVCIIMASLIVMRNVLNTEMSYFRGLE